MLATRAIQRRLGDRETKVAFIDGLWTRKVGAYFLPDSAKFNYLKTDPRSWKGQIIQYEADTKEYWLQHYVPKTGDVIVDVGAGRGEDTFTFSRAVGVNGRVIAIEAHPLSYTILANFCRLNRLANVLPLGLALMNKRGTVSLAESEESWLENAVSSNDEPSGVRVQAATLDGICEQHQIKSINFLKMNIEGAEQFALLGMQSMIRHIDQVCVACHDFRADAGHGEHFRTRSFVTKFLEDYGFQVSVRDGDSRDYVRDHVFGIRKV